MANYNKKTHLAANIEAIKVAFELQRAKRSATTEELTVLRDYSGFGGLKCILSPANSPSDVASWSKSEQELFPLVMELHAVIREHTASESEYRQYVGSLKNSVLTAFYTPPEVVAAIASSLKTAGITPARFLDPSAGMGEFVSAFEGKEAISFEKDILTGQILRATHPETAVHIKGFEEIETRFNGYFDLVSSNIPFGDVAVFDPAFVKSEELAKKFAAKSLHNYFFVKSIDTLRNGGVLAFITSQGVMNRRQAESNRARSNYRSAKEEDEVNAPSNEPVREWLMQNTNLVSAIRLPNNLFSEIAGTDVGSDLIVLQKNTAKKELSPDEQRFVKSVERPSGVMFNTYFQNLSRVVHTSWKQDTDPYGKPAIVFKHEGGISGIASDMGRMLVDDFANRLNIDLYHQLAAHVEPPKVVPQVATQMDLFDTEVKVHYNSSADEYSVKAQYSNANIWDRYCVRGEHRSYDGVALMKHALLNTTSDITKKIMVEGKEVKVRDTDAIQMANAKIDEIRNGFTDWLNEQSDEFKNRLEKLYNETFNCFVRPEYDGSHQTFADLDLKGLGIDGLYDSQKDAVWMLKLNGGGGN